MGWSAGHRVGACRVPCVARGKLMKVLTSPHHIDEEPDLHQPRACLVQGTVLSSDHVSPHSHAVHLKHPLWARHLFMS